MSIRLHSKHGLAPALMVCPLCGQETNGIALLGSSADKVMREAGQDGYHEYGHNRIPDAEPCNECKGILDGQGVIIIAEDYQQSLRLGKEQVDSLIGKIGDSKGRVLDFDKMRGKVIRMPRAFWTVDGDNIRMRDPKEWTD